VQEPAPNRPIDKGLAVPALEAGNGKTKIARPETTRHRGVVRLLAGSQGENIRQLLVESKMFTSAAYDADKAGPVSEFPQNG
jgi:hypothetical protein